MKVNLGAMFQTPDAGKQGGFDVDARYSGQCVRGNEGLPSARVGNIDPGKVDSDTGN
jgi:hypothetical protein